ncbi:hypothetical protein KR054_010419 [Drosophila jambulina]|nr:hypothetical protein KR054_010419 [Drosophila jambulina]
MRLEKIFDYSSSQPEDDETQDSLDSDDEEFQLNARQGEPKLSSRKRRRSSHKSSPSSGVSSLQLAPRLIYLDLEPPVATIMKEPLPNLVLDNDADLKTKIHKFLGLMPRRRKLYNSEDHLYKEQDEPPYKKAPPPQAPHFHLHTLTLEKRKAKMLDDDNTTKLINASTIDPETQDSTKAPIDLPSEKWRDITCRRHKRCIACLEDHPLSYSFIDSLNPATSIKLCHPLALTYRKRDFKSCKRPLAKLLFNIFNHAIFHCALNLDIEWVRSLGKPCRCELTIDSSGQRSARLLLWEKIKHPDSLIKPLLHEMCHAAAFVLNRETGHGENCRQWARRASQQLMELTLIEACDARYKYVCSMCGRGSYGLVDFAATKDMLRCHHCQFEVVVEPWSAYDGIRPDTRMTKFKSFIFDKYQDFVEQEESSSHSSKMRFLNQQYLKMKAASD